MAADDGRRKGGRLTDTIYALSSGAPPAAVAVVRISGPKAHDALLALAGRLPEPRVAKLVRLREGGELLDSALVLRFVGPASETGEDVAELQLHGGRSVVAAVLAALGRIEGLRLAEPGEFTRRSFENGRIDLAEAEGLADLIEAETESQRRAAMALAGGALSRQVADWQARLLALAARIEAELDFDDEGDVQKLRQSCANSDIAALAVEMDEWLARPAAERLRDGIRIVIAGPPNEGKSSLINALVGREAAITSAIPGTTRDLVEAPVAIGGTPFLFTDTAGLRDGEDPIEAIGVARAREALAGADIILWLGPPEECPDPARSILVQSKHDLSPPARRADVRVSAATGEGLEVLVALLTARAATLLPAEGEVALNARHRAAFADAATALREGASEGDPLIVAESLRHARAALDRITGRAGVENMLDALFGRFCIGK